VSAPAAQQSAAFAVAEAVRWIEIAMNSLSFFLAGLTLFLYGGAIVLRSVYPRWVGLIAMVSGADEVDKKNQAQWWVAFSLNPSARPRQPQGALSAGWADFQISLIWGMRLVPNDCYGSGVI
jgi:hypothetical protein